MTRALRVGDRVTATGTVTRIATTLLDPEIVCAVITFDGDRYETGEGTALSLDALTLIAPAEPPTGSVVVKDGVAWISENQQIANESGPWWSTERNEWAAWPDLSDGEVIFTPGGEA